MPSCLSAEFGEPVSLMSHFKTRRQSIPFLACPFQRGLNHVGSTTGDAQERVVIAVGQITESWILGSTSRHGSFMAVAPRFL